MKAIEKPLAIIYLTLFSLLALLFFVLSTTGCSSDRIEGNQDLVTQTRPSQPFSEVVSEGSFYVKIIPSTETRIEVKGESNIIAHLSTYSNGTTVTLKFNDGLSILEHYPVEVYLYTPTLHSVRLPGSGTVVCESFSTTTMYLGISGSGSIIGDFVSEKVEADISGSGNIDLSGEATTGVYTVSGSGNITANNLHVEYCSANVSGSGNMTLYATKTLDVDISGSGTITYLLNPVVTSKITGSGRLVKF
jgi:hypothetical protein